MSRSVALIGARGYVGRELLALLARHPSLEVALASSRELAGRPVSEVTGDVAPGRLEDLRFEELGPDDVAARAADAYVLALPNGKCAPFVEAIAKTRPDAVLIDLSADHRFDDGWVYGLPERRREALRGAKRIANPGCYATAIQLGLAPLVELLEGPPRAFGVSGYSGAGTTPSPKNDPEVLRDNLLPYSLTGHVHEREVTRHLGHPVHFLPHVASWFRGIHVTLDATLRAPLSLDELRARFVERYRDEPLIRVGDEAPCVRDIAGRNDVALGGFAVSDDGRRAVVVATIDNLLKGAATQAVQNLNLAFGLDELAGIDAGG